MKNRTDMELMNNLDRVTDSGDKNMGDMVLAKYPALLMVEECNM